MNKVVGGWQLAGILTTGTGTPYSVTFTPTQLGWLTGRADITSYTAATPSDRSTDRWFAPEAFKTPQPFTTATALRTLFSDPDW